MRYNQQAAVRVYVIVRVNKPTHLGIIVSALEIVESKVLVVVVTSVSEGILCCVGIFTAVMETYVCISPGVIGL